MPWVRRGRDGRLDLEDEFKTIVDGLNSASARGLGGERPDLGQPDDQNDHS